jgi:hypothetical protein
MVFSEDLLACTRLLYNFTELVCSRNSNQIGPVHDMRVARFSNSSQALQSALYGLKKYFHKDLHKAVDSVNTFACYLHKSFLMAMQYKRPYSPSNPHGLSVDCTATMTKDFNVDRVVIETFKMVTMGMLLVHHFVLEHIMFMAALNDEVYNKPLFSEDKKKFVEMMKDLAKYMEFEVDDTIKDLLKLKGVTLRDKTREYLISNYVDFTYTYQELIDLFEVGTAHCPLVIRSLYFSHIIKSLAYYKDALPAENLAKTTEDRTLFKFKILHMNNFSTFRHVEDSNPRQRLQREFMSYTKNPVHYYATVSYAEESTNGSVVIQQTGSNVNVVPRRQVHVWRKVVEPQEEGFDKQMALVHGEVALMVDLMFSMAPVVMHNRYYRDTESCGPEYVHMMLARMSGPFDIITRFSEKQTAAFKTRVREGNSVTTGVVDPSIPTAVVVQPMPQSLRKWALGISKHTNATGANLTDMLTNGVLHRSTSINLNDTVKKAVVNPTSSNVIVNGVSRFPAALWDMNKMYSVNSVFFLHYGNALVTIPLFRDRKLLGSDKDTLTLTEAECDVYHTLAFLDIYTAGQGNTFEYISSTQLQTELKKQMDALTATVKDAPAPFIHPSSWLTNQIITTQEWEKCDESFDLNKGTFVTFTPDTGPFVPDANQADVETAIHRFLNLP